MPRQWGGLLQVTARQLAGGEAVGRLAVTLDDDSDTEAFEDIPMGEDTDASARIRRQERWKGGEFRLVTFKDLELNVKACDKGRGVAVPLEGGGELGESLETPARAGARRRWVVDS